MDMQILKVIPYSATQLCTYDFLKRRMAGNDKDKRLTVQQRMLAGACAGMFATLVSHLLNPGTAAIGQCIISNSSLSGYLASTMSAWAHKSIRTQMLSRLSTHIVSP